MTNCIVLSDTHGDIARLRSLLRAERSLDAVLFLGDGLSELEELASEGWLPPVVAVRGNCDSAFSPLMYPRDEEITITLEGKRILLLHGHTVSVKSGTDGLLSRARARDADIVLFGHTHAPLDTYIPKERGGPLWLFNPGSLGRPTDARPSFGRLTLSARGGVLLSHGVWEGRA